jgi:serine/threonine-protein kinase
MSVGTQLGRYRLEERLGQGGMATVFRARDPQLGRDVAIKVMHPFVAERSEASQRFEREARAVAGLRHPNVLALHDYHPAEGDTPAYLVMELLTGPSLRSFLDQHGAPLAEVGAIIAVRVAQALEAAHQRGIVHRDVKPENVMFDGSRVVLCDFGIARVVADGASGFTATGALIGSPAYMSPEQARGDAVDARSDLFSLGSLIYVLATGGAPFVASQPLAIMNRIAKGEHAPPSAKNPRVPRWLERIIERCLRVNPADRYTSAREVVEALTAGLSADGLGDLDGELAAYLADPPEYNRRFAARVIASSLAQARAALAEGQRARGLAAASRVLSWDPQNPEALALTVQPRTTRVWLGAAALLVLAGAAGTTWWKLRAVAEPPPLPPPRAVVAPPPSDPPRPSLALLPEPHTTFELHADTKPRRRNKPEPAARPEAPIEKPAEPAVEAPPERPAEPERPARLTVAIAPWCDLTVDGSARGRTPQTLTLAPGKHRVECANPISHASFVRDIELGAGEETALKERLYAAAHVTAQLKRGDAFSLDDGAPGAGTRDATPGRHRVTVYAKGRELDSRYLDVRPEGCRLVDSPELACQKP